MTFLYINVDPNCNVLLLNISAKTGFSVSLVFVVVFVLPYPPLYPVIKYAHSGFWFSAKYNLLANACWGIGINVDASP